jgi:hypothetical protein
MHLLLVPRQPNRAEVGMEAFPRPSSLSRVVRTKRRRRAAQIIDISPVVVLEAAARAGSHILHRAKPPPWRRTAQIPSRRAKKTTRHHRPNLVSKQQARPYAVSRAQISSRRGLVHDSANLFAKRARTEVHCAPDKKNNWYVLSEAHFLFFYYPYITTAIIVIPI